MTSLGATAASPFVTLVVPVRNESRHIVACLRSLLGQTYPNDALEILVVDGRSTDGTREIVREWATREPRLRLLDNPAERMPAGLNAGIAAARGEVVGVISGHSVPGSDYVERGVRLLLETNAWSVGGAIRRVASTPMGRAIARATASRVGVGDARHNYATSAGWAETVFPGLWPRWVFERVGHFDASMLANEDNEFSYRIRRAGGGIWYDPSIAIEYVPRGSLADLFRQYRDYGRGKLRVFARHRGGIGWRHLVPPLWLLLVVGLPLVGVVWPAATVTWVALLVVYMATVLVAAHRLRDATTPAHMIALALLTLHVAYGVGMLLGAGDLAFRGLRAMRAGSSRPR